MSGDKIFCTEIQEQRGCCAIVIIHPNLVTLAHECMLTKFTTPVQIVDFGYGKSYVLQ